MSYTSENYTDVEPRAPGMHFLRDALDCDNLGLTVVEADPGWEGMEHDHGEESHEEVYLLVDGDGEITVDGESVSLTPGDAVRVDPGASRQLRFNEESTMVIAGAP
jgi:mannose-6-phosphate isomerase-like protein (cupin superfamily)